MALRKVILNFVAKKYRKYKAMRLEEREGFKKIEQREAYLLEPILTIQEKQHYCERKAYSQLKYFPNLNEPRSYNEKLIWLALYYKNPIITQCSDKYEVKKYIKDKVGEKHYVPALGVYTDPNDIDFDALPNRFVLKSTTGWGSKQVIIVKEKRNLNIEKTKSRLAEWLYPWNTYYYNNLCITDDKSKPRIVVEQYINAPKDYKIFCFNGEAKCILIVSGRDENKIRKTFLDIESWKELPITRNNTKVERNIDRPENLDKLIEISEKLSKKLPLLRVDFYISGDDIYVGEMTFYPGMFLKINPVEWDYKLGKLINLEGVQDYDEK